MSEEENVTAPPARAGAGPNYMLLLLFLMLIIMIFPELRDGMARAIDFVLFPLIGFDYRYPLLTIVLAGLFMTLLNVVVRHFLIDWLEMAKVQHKFKYLSSLMQEARRKGDTKTLEKLVKLQAELMPEQMENQNRMMRPTVATFLIVIAVFTWLWMFVSNAPEPTARLPWGAVVNLGDMFLIFPVWLILYSFVSIPVMILVQNGLKLMYYKSVLEEG